MSDIVTGRIFSNGEVGITATKMNEIISRSVIQPDLIGTKPAASSAGSTDYLLLLKSDGTLAKIAGDAFNTSVANAILPQVDAKIWSARLRSFNAVGNPNFEVDQRSVGNSVAITNAASPFIQDRWSVNSSGATMRISAQQQSGNVLLPGTNFFITSKFLRITLTAAQATLAVGDIIQIFQNMEGPRLRELLGDVHSVSLLVRSTVGNLNVGFALQDNSSAHSLVKLCSLGVANTWTLISLPNLPIWPGAGTFPIVPGGIGYYLIITLAAGSTLVAPANDTWQNGNFLGAVGQSNFAASPVNSTFDIAFCQHEPGPCTTLMDLDFDTNLSRCLKYYQKTYDYATAVGTATANGSLSLPQLNTAAIAGVKFVKPMAKTPTFIVYNHSTGAANSFNHLNGTNYGVTATYGLGQGGLQAIGTATLPAPTAGASGYIHYTADTGW